MREWKEILSTVKKNLKLSEEDYKYDLSLTDIVEKNESEKMLFISVPFLEHSTEIDFTKEFLQSVEYLESWSEDVHVEQDLWDYIQYWDERELLKGIVTFPVILNEKGDELLYKANYINHFLFNDVENVDRSIRQFYFKYGIHYEYKKGNYEIQFLKDGISMVRASEILSNCL